MTATAFDAAATTKLRGLQLLGRWRRGLRNHVPGAGLACACGVGFSGLAVSDFEVPILDYLYSRHGTQPSLRALFEEAGYREGESGQVAELLGALVRQQDGGPDAIALLADLERSLDSFIGAHSRGSGGGS